MMTSTNDLHALARCAPRRRDRCGGDRLSIARVLALALGGADVTVLERDAIGAGTMATAFAWIDANGKTPAWRAEPTLGGMAAHHDCRERSVRVVMATGQAELPPIASSGIRAALRGVCSRLFPCAPLGHTEKAPRSPCFQGFAGLRRGGDGGI
jgi:hypothetical protein